MATFNWRQTSIKIFEKKRGNKAFLLHGILSFIEAKSFNRNYMVKYALKAFTCMLFTVFDISSVYYLFQL